MISVIMPVYNVEKYVSDCIESVLNQTYKNFELIIVNDGSTDNSLNEAKKYLCDSRVHIYSQENKGLSAARNTGLKCVKGDYIYFIDSDDVINQNLFDLLIGEFSNHQETDLISFGYTEFETGLSVNTDLKLSEITGLKMYFFTGLNAALHVVPCNLSYDMICQKF